MLRIRKGVGKAPRRASGSRRGWRPGSWRISSSFSLSATPSHCLASSGAGFFSLITGHFLASSAFSLRKLCWPSGISSSEKMASTGHSGSQSVQSIHSSGSITRKFWTLVEAVDGTDLDAIHVLALDAALGDHECHDLPFCCHARRISMDGAPCGYCASSPAGAPGGNSAPFGSGGGRRVPRSDPRGQDLRPPRELRRMMAFSPRGAILEIFAPAVNSPLGNASSGPGESPPRRTACTSRLSGPGGEFRLVQLGAEHHVDLSRAGNAHQCEQRADRDLGECFTS